MKKISAFLSVIIFMTFLCSCNKIEKAKTDNNSVKQSEYVDTSMTIQSESPPETTTLPSDTTTTTPTTQKNTTTKKNTTKATTTTKPATTTTKSNTPTNVNSAVQIGVWFAYVNPVTSSNGKTADQFREQLRQAYANVKSLGVNTIYFQVRAFGDAYYKSSYFPWSSRCAGAIGKEPSYDPMTIMIDEAHKQGLSFHAWINPMRGPSPSDITKFSDSTPIKQWYNDSSTNGKYIVSVTKKDANGKDVTNYYLNPAYPEVRQLINNGVAEIVRNYNVDAIHIDDYFYPTTDASFDSDAWIKAGQPNLGNWRRSNTDAMVSGMYSTIKSIKSNVTFEVSPQGNSSNNYNSQYIDVAKWCSTTGYIDCLIPQFYYNYNTYTARENEFNNMVKNPNIKIVSGLAPYSVVQRQSGFTSGDILARQISYSKSLSRYGGVAFFSYDYLISSDSLMQQERNNFIPLLK